MTLARVCGTVVSTAKIKALEGRKLMIVHPITPDGEFIGKEFVAVDSLQSGPGDDVLVIDEGGSAGIILGMTSQPIRTVIAAIIDRVDLLKEVKDVQ